MSIYLSIYLSTWTVEEPQKLEGRA